MGRFKIYDTNSLVSILEDSKYAKCLVCEKVLKNIMGNIKRHYEQIHDTVLDATIMPKKKSKRKSPNESTKPRRTKKNTKATITSIGNGINDINYDWINEYQLDCMSRPALTIISTPSGNKIYQQLETRKSSTSSQPEGADTSSSDQQFRISTVSASPQLNQIQIKSLDWHNNTAILNCQLTTKTPFDIPLEGLQAGSTFEAALQSWCPNTNSAIDPKTISQLLDNRIQNVRQVIKDITLKRFVYLKLDIASIKGNNLMLVNIQFLRDFQIKIFTLSVLELLDDLNAPVLKGHVLTALERYNIDINQVYSITKDYTYNVRESVSYVKEEQHMINNQNVTHDYCQQMTEQFPGHVLHFVACDVIKQLTENISQSRDSVRKLKHCMPQYNLEPIPKIDNSNSWISIYDMLKSLLAIRKKIENNAQLQVEIDWVFISKFEASFKPVVDTAVQLQSKHFIMGDLYREWLACEYELEELSLTNEIALYLLQALRIRKALLFDNSPFLAALYLDPRFCYMGSMHFNDKQKKMAIAHLLQIFEKLKSMDEIKTKSTTKPTKDNNNARYLKLEKKMSDGMGICNKMNIVLQSNANNGAVSLERIDRQSIEEALEQLQFDERLPFHANILDYWKTIKYKNPVLAKLAELALAVPATQATINRAFNVLPVMLMKHKNNISLDNLEYILLLQLNQDVVDKLS